MKSCGSQALKAFHQSPHRQSGIHIFAWTSVSLPNAVIQVLNKWTASPRALHSLKKQTKHLPEFWFDHFLKAQFEWTSKDVVFGCTCENKQMAINNDGRTDAQCRRKKKCVRRFSTKCIFEGFLYASLIQFQAQGRGGTSEPAWSLGVLNVWNVKCLKVLYKNVVLHLHEMAADQFPLFILLQGNENGITLISDNPFIKKKELGPFEKGIRIDYILFKVGGRAFRSPRSLHF